MDREAEEADPDSYKGGMGKLYQMNIKFAQDHNTIVQRFGRYPHRNKYLGRESTEAEKEYLEQKKEHWAK